MTIHKRAALPALAMFCLGSLASCEGDKPTQLVLSIATDLLVPNQLDSVAVHIDHLETSIEKSYALDTTTGYALPGTLAISAGADPNEKVLITVKGIKGGHEVVSRQARTHFIKDRLLLLRITLLIRCKDLTSPCASEQTCGEHGCQSIDVDPATLPDYNEKEALEGLDAGSGAGDFTLADAQEGGPTEATIRDLPQPDSNTCGNKIKDGHDQCDDQDLGSPPATCESKGLTGGTIACTDECRLDLSNCQTSAFALIQPGNFTMGSPVDEACRVTDTNFSETPHEVSLTRPFEIAITEVTQAQYKALLNDEPSFNKPCGGDCPVESVNWNQAAAYCNALSEQVGLARCYTCTGASTSTTCTEASDYEGKDIYSCPGYRLPTEAEWEYAYRAGSTTPFYVSQNCDGTLDTPCDDLQENYDKIGWCGQNSAGAIHPVKAKEPNAWGLYDMAGNVWEWCHDWYAKDLGGSFASDPVTTCSKDCMLRVSRGGSHEEGFSYMRAAIRNRMDPDREMDHVGFRCVRTRQ
ncbi:MAG: formylglycine-generating enzyme family protein [Deltaproteobacteria bacterium]|nr:formylglycine-generating enzyme family protein [Deltaproteobacteria bacterium]